MGIVVIGSVFVDIKGYPLSQYLDRGRNEGRIEHVHGGVARNVVEDIANLELRPTFVGLVDDTAMGNEVREKLIRHKVNTDYMRAVKDGMGTWLAIFDNEGDVAASISKRPDLMPIGEILEEQGDEIFRDAESIVFELDLERPVVKKIFRLAEKYDKPVYALISNMSIALQRRDFLKKLGCFVCNQQEAGILFSLDLDSVTPEEMCHILREKISQVGIVRMVVTMGEKGAVYASREGESGVIPAQTVQVKDTTGAGDSFFAGVVAGLGDGKTLEESCIIGTRLAASVIVTEDNVCPRFEPAEFGLRRK